MSEAAIETERLTKFYGKARGIEGVDLEVGRGEVFGFLGPNGAGKTTTIRLLLDLIRPTGGRATVLGLDAQRDSVEVRRRTTYLPGELKLPPKHTAGGFLAHLGRLRGGVPRAEIERLSESVGLDTERRIGDLSKGNKQKVGVVAAFMHDPELLILDEPTSGLDPIVQETVHDLISERVGAGRTVFLSSHVLDEVEHVATRVGIIRNGRMIAVEEIAGLKRRAIREVEVRLADGDTIDGLDRLPGVRDVVSEDGVVKLRVEGSMDPLVKELARHNIVTLTSETPDLDEIFLAYYGRTHGS